MYARNNIGPSTVPWGTPEVTSTEMDDVPSNATVCVLSERKTFIQFNVSSLMP